MAGLFRCCISLAPMTVSLGPLSQMQMIDFAIDFDEGCRALLRVWGIGYAPQ